MGFIIPIVLNNTLELVVVATKAVLVKKVIGYFDDTDYH